jgi:hypothetical protein
VIDLAALRASATLGLQANSALDKGYATAVYQQEFSPSTALALLDELEQLRAEVEHMRPVYVLACRLQDADQCEDHCTGDECEQGDIEHEFFQALVIARGDDPERTDPLERGDKQRKPAAASIRSHILNDTDECVSWCVACRENGSRGLNPDGTTKEASR